MNRDIFNEVVGLHQEEKLYLIILGLDHYSACCVVTVTQAGASVPWNFGKNKIHLNLFFYLLPLCAYLPCMVSSVYRNRARLLAKIIKEFIHTGLGIEPADQMSDKLEASNLYEY